MHLSTSLILTLLGLFLILNNPSSVDAASEDEEEQEEYNLWDLPKLVKKQAARLEKLEATVRRQGASLKDLARKQVSGFQELEGNIQEVRTNLDGGLRHLRRDAANQRAVVAKVETSLKDLQLGGSKRQIAFTAHSTDHPMGLPSTQPLKFQYVISRIGPEGYNHESGIFKAPVAGLYVFYAQMMNNKYRKYLGYVIEKVAKNSNVLATTLCRSFLEKGSSESSSCLATVHLREGDRVFVRKADGPSSWDAKVFGTWSSAFSGFLIAAD